MNLKKLDEIDMVVIDQPWTDEERIEFSAFLRKRKLRQEKKPVVPARKHTTATGKQQQ